MTGGVTQPNVIFNLADHFHSIYELRILIRGITFGLFTNSA